MAPRKNAKNNNTTPKVPTKRSSRIVKRNSNISTDIKMEIPVKKRFGRQSKVSKKDILSHEHSIELANEVVNLHFNHKPRTIAKPILEYNLSDCEVQSELVVSRYFETGNTEVNGNTYVKPKRNVTKKIATDTVPTITASTVPTKTITRKRPADSTQKIGKHTKLKTQGKETVKKKTVARKASKKKAKGKKSCSSKQSKSNNTTLEFVSTVDDVKTNAGRVDSRKTSSTSTSCMSWTKNLSSSSANSILATRSDFVRIDKKLPVLELTNINRNIDIKNVNDIDTSSSESDSTISEKSIGTLENNYKELNLSSSSQSTSLYGYCQNNALKQKLAKAFDRLSVTSRYFDMEIINWVGRENIDLKNGFNHIFKVLNEENEINNDCRRFKSMFSMNDGLNLPLECDKESRDIIVEANINNVDFKTTNVAENLIKNDNGSANQTLHNKSADNDVDIQSKTSDNGQHSDEDDAISIYAESITGIESEKYYNSVTPVFKGLDDFEYIPKPIKDNDESKNYTYSPTKISNEDQTIVKKSVCEKQNADSTSIFKENDCERVSASDIAPVASDPNLFVTNEIRNPTKRLCYVFKHLICRYNLYQCCGHTSCRYLHIVPDVLEVKNKLLGLNDAQFISEFVEIRGVCPVMSKYGFCFVEVCCTRDLPRVLIDMAFYFFSRKKIIWKQDNNVMVKDIFETILLKLNWVDLMICNDLLLKNVVPGSMTLLCDIFMETIAETQNFSRFKPVFLKLAFFMVSNNCKFNLTAVEGVLERLCVLSPDVSLSKALLHMIKNTNADIFKHNNMDRFENMLSTLDRKLYDDLITFKMEAFAAEVTKPVDPDALISNVNSDKKNRPPDTTDVNGLQVCDGPGPIVRANTTQYLDIPQSNAMTLTRTVRFDKPYTSKDNNSSLLNDNENWKRKDYSKQWRPISEQNNYSRPRIEQNNYSGPRIEQNNYPFPKTEQNNYSYLRTEQNHYSHPKYPMQRSNGRCQFKNDRHVAFRQRFNKNQFRPYEY